MFHREIDNWKSLVTQKVARPTHLANIVRQDPTHLGFYNSSSIGTGGLWLDPSRSGLIIVWHHPLSPEIIAVLISDKNPEGMLTNFDLELSALILHEGTLLEVCPDANMAAPRSG